MLMLMPFSVLAFESHRVQTYSALNGEFSMARMKSLSSMSVEALLKMRDDIGAALARKADDLKKELAALGSAPLRGRGYKRKSLAGRKVAPKYRGPEGETWAGRGAQPRWLTAAIKQGKRRDHFLIEQPKRAQKTRRKK
jgi:DNA-binding protein H-NS